MIEYLEPRLDAKPGEEEIAYEDDTKQIVRVYSEAGWTETDQYKPGLEPVVYKSVEELKKSLHAAKDVQEVQSVLGDILDVLESKGF